MIKLTESAKSKVNELLQEEQALYLRVFVQGGGCSGFQYGFSFDEKKDDDIEILAGNVRLLIDFMSMEYLKDIEIDYIEDLRGQSFVIKNPNATTTCGCGSSFSV